MQNQNIKNDQITTNAHNFDETDKARLYVWDGLWKDNSNGRLYIKVDLGGLFNVTGVSIQGSEQYLQYFVKTYRVEVCYDETCNNKMYLPGTVYQNIYSI